MTERGGPELVFSLAVALLPPLLGCQSVQTPEDGKAWGTRELIETGLAGALRPQIAIDAMGNAIAVWDQATQATDISSDDIWSNRPDAGGQWGTAVLLEENEPGDSFAAQIGVSGDGSAVVVFLQDEGTYFSIWAVRHTPSGVWENPVCIQSGDPKCAESNSPGDAGQHQVAVDPRGGAVVVWQQLGQEDDVQRLSIWSNRFTTGKGWGDAGPVESDEALSVPQVAIDDNGNAIVVWEGFDGVRSSIWSRRLTRDGGREALLNVEADDSGNAFFPQVAADAEGNAIAVWQQQRELTNDRFGIWSSRYVASAGEWDIAERIDAAVSGDAEKPQIAMDGNGSAFAVWVQSGGDRAGIWSNRYVANAGWGTAAPIGPRGFGSARSPQVASNPDGNAVAVWVQFDLVQDSVWSNRYTANGGWGRSEAIEMDDENFVQGPQVAVDLEGNAAAIWSQGTVGAGLDVWSNRLSSDTEDVAATRVPGLGTR